METAKWTTEDLVKATLLDYAKRRLEEYKAAEARFRDLAERNPLNAVEYGREVVEAQVAYYEVWRYVEHDLGESIPVAEVLGQAIERTMRQVGSTLGGGSTCPFQRAVERARGAVLFRELEALQTQARVLGHKA